MGTFFFEFFYYFTSFQDGQDDDAVVETVDERDIPDDTFSMGDTFEPISNAFDPLRDAVQPVTTAFNTPVGATVGAVSF